MGYIIHGAGRIKIILEQAKRNKLEMIRSRKKKVTVDNIGMIPCYPGDIPLAILE